MDGGTRRWDHFLNNLPKEEQLVAKLPDLVTGDFDSITEEILQKYKSKGCKVIFFLLIFLSNLCMVFFCFS